MEERLLRVEGLVQGVGFRPFVWRIATELGLDGSVLNDGRGVSIEVRGSRSAIARLRSRICDEAPPLARIDGVSELPLARTRRPRRGFRIARSLGGAITTGVVPDAAVCPSCMREVSDPSDRRYGYAFTNCTHCGPRFTIVEGIPYDRPNTTMAGFEMCPACSSEHRDPRDRRFHAQPNGCPRCGPRLWFEDVSLETKQAGALVRMGRAVGADPLERALQRLREGAIVAIKGLGGFHLACDATDEAVVRELRRRKRREAKPLAIMMPDLTAVEASYWVDEREREALRSTAAPLLLLRPRDPDGLAPSVTAGQPEVAVMLPYTPLHHLLLQGFGRPLVMTSGNESGAPQVIDNDEARSALAGIAEGFLMHDRPIAQRLDDSVARIRGARLRVLRRARGYAPASIRLHESLVGCAPVLAMGAELKTTACLLREGRATLTQHLGDLHDARTAQEYERAITLYRELFRFEPGAVAVDLHRDYRSTRVGERIAAERDVPLVAVQHHHAHLASALAEGGHPLDGPEVLGLAMDGLGLGDNGEIWGCELMLASFGRCERLGSLRRVALPGGDKATREPWRNLVAQLEACFGWEEAKSRWGGTSALRLIGCEPPRAVIELIRKGVQAPLASSAGRLFDAVAAALGVRARSISFEGQAAMELEALARRANLGSSGGYPFGRIEEGGVRRLDPAPMWEALLDELGAGVGRETLSARFHIGFARAAAELALELAGAAGVDRAVLSGGVFQNPLFANALREHLTRAGIEVLENALVPPNDGGLSLGQAAIAAARSNGTYAREVA